MMKDGMWPAFRKYKDVIHKEKQYRKYWKESKKPLKFALFEELI